MRHKRVKTCEIIERRQIERVLKKTSWRTESSLLYSFLFVFFLGKNLKQDNKQKDWAKKLK